MTKILITEFINQSSLKNLNKKFDVKYDEKLYENEKQLITMIKDYEGLIVRNKTQVNSKILKNALKLKFIGRLGVGLDNIDTGYCKSKNIHVQPATGMNADSVAEYVVSSSMSLIKKIPMFHNGTIKGEWPRTTIKSIEINQKYLGIIGFGTIGKKVAEYSSKNGLKIYLEIGFLLTRMAGFPLFLPWGPLGPAPLPWGPCALFGPRGPNWVP